MVLNCDYDHFHQIDGCTDEFTVVFSVYVGIALGSYSSIPNLEYCSSTCYVPDLRNAYEGEHCLPACLSPQCGFSMGLCQTQLAPNCEVGWGPGNNQCFQCKAPYVQYYGACIQTCPRALQAYALFPRLCVPKSDISTSDAPDRLYVLESTASDDQYANFMDALAAAWAKYTVISLLGEKITYRLNYMYSHMNSPEYSTHKHFPDLLADASWIYLKVQSLPCAVDSQIGCYAGATTVYIYPTAINIPLGKTLVFEGVILTTRQLFAYDSVLYCPMLRKEPSGYLNDRDEIVPNVRNSLFQCNNYANVILFQVNSGAELRLKDVKIQDFTIQLKAIVLLEGGNVYFSNVAFSNVQPGMNSGLQAVILGLKECNFLSSCGEFSYQIGKVELLNNGYELKDNIRLNPFLRVAAIGSILIEDVVFQYNAVLASSEEIGLLTIGNFLQFSMTRCVLDSSMLFTRFLDIRSALSLPPEKKNDPQWNAKTHISLSYVTIKKTLSGTHLILIHMTNTLLNIAISDCSFSQTSLTAGNIIHIEFAGVLTSQMISGTKDPKTGLILAPNFVSILRSSFTDLPAFGYILSLNQLANVDFQDISFARNTDLMGQTDHITAIYYITAKETYAQLIPKDLASAQCQNTLYLSNSVHSAGRNITIASNICTFGGTGLAYASSHGNHFLSSISISNNKSGGEFGAGISLISSVNVTISGLKAFSNTAESKGVISLSAGTHLSLTNSTLQDNTGYTGAGISAAGAISLIVANTVFKGNKAASSEGGAIYFLPSHSPSGLFTISSCSFEGNSANSGGAVNILQSTGSAALLFTLRNSAFAYNQVNTAGASLAVGSTVRLAGESRVEGCTFRFERSTLGALSLMQLGGNLLIKDSSFEDCSGDPIAVLSLQTGDTALTTLDSVTIQRSTGKAAIRKANTLLYSVLVTSHCSFLSNQITVLFFESGSWEDANSQFRGNLNTAVVTRASARAQLTSTLFQDNVSQNASAAFHASGSVLNCTGCVFRNNTAAYGSALMVEQESSLTLYNCLFEANKARDYAPAISAQGTLLTPTLISHCIFQYNSGPNGLIVLFNGRMDLDSVLFQSNTAATGSPSITTLQSTLVGNNLTFRRQVGTDAPFFSIQTGCNVSISNSEMYDGFGSESGAIELSGSTLNVTKSTFHQLTGSISALLYTQGVNSVLFTAVTAYDLHSEGEGSVIDSSFSTLTITDSYFYGFEQGAVEGVVMLSVNIGKTRFERGRGGKGSGFSCTECQDILIFDSHFELLNATFGGAIALLACPNVTISSTVFKANRAETGGGVYAEDSVLLISDSAFYENTANGTEGGGLYVDCPGLENCGYQVVNTVFEGNTAHISGGALAWKQAKPDLINVTTANNSAYYGPNFASFPTHLEIRPSRLLQELTDLPPGQPAKVTITAALLDHYGQIVLTDNSSAASLEAIGSAASVSGTSKATAINGVFTFDDFSIYAEPLGNVTLNVVTSGIPDSSILDQVSYKRTVAIDVRMRDCLSGESAAAQSCNPCGNRTYGFSPLKPCQNCPANAQCMGTTQMYPNSGYWRSGVYEEIIWMCPRPNSCLGGDPFDNHSISWTGHCAQGYTSNMCESCAWGYSRTGKDKCGKCPPLNVNILRISGVAVAMVAYNAYQVWGALKTATKPTAVHSIYLKILTNYLQLVFLVTEFRLSWPQPVLDLFSSQESSGGVTEQLYSIECFLSSNGDSSKVYFEKMIFMALLPAAISVAVILFWGIVTLKTGKLKYLREELAASLVIAFFFIHPTLTKALFSMFSCTEINSGEFWLTIDLAISCYDSKHYLYIFAVGIPAIAVWVFAVPLLCLIVLIRNRRHLDELWLRLQYGFLIGGFSRKRYYWEFVVTFRKIAVICCSVFFTNSVEIQALTVQVLLIGFFLLQLRVSPYTLPELNSTELKAIAVADLTIYCGLYYLTESLSEGSSWFFFVLIVLANVVFLLYWAVGFLGHMVDKAALAVPCLGLILRPQAFECDPFIDDFIENLPVFQGKYSKTRKLVSLQDLYVRLLHSANLYSDMPSFEQPSYEPSKPVIEESSVYSFSRADSAVEICHPTNPETEINDTTNRSFL